MKINLFVQQNQDKETIDSFSRAQIVKYILEKVQNKVSDEMTEEDKAKMSAKILQKLKAGKKLTKKEEQFLKETNPQMYIQYLRIRARAEAMAEQLKHAKTKQQANHIIMVATASVSNKDPYKEYVLAAMYKVADEYKAAPKYQRLPNTEAELEKKENVKENDNFEKEEDSVENFDPMSWSPLQDVIDAMPKFDVPA